MYKNFKYIKKIPGNLKINFSITAYFLFFDVSLYP